MANRVEHIAIIMDGNGRWATERGLQRAKGHEKGAETVRALTTYASNHPEIKTLTLYAFSTENWRRPKMEVQFLMRLLARYLKNEIPTYQKHGVRFETIGDLSRFSNALQAQINQTKEATRHGTKLTQVLALNYGAHDEIARAAAALCQEGIKPTPESIEKRLDSAPFGPVDLLIRTGGEQRLSNFLLWQSAYAELFFTPTYWPDFSIEELESILSSFQYRERRFGGI